MKEASSVVTGALLQEQKCEESGFPYPCKDRTKHYLAVAQQRNVIQRMVQLSEEGRHIAVSFLLALVEWLS